GRLRESRWRRSGGSGPRRSSNGWLNTYWWRRHFRGRNEMMRIRNGGKGSRFAAMVVGLLVSCETECAGKEAVQSVLHPASGEAAAIAHAWWLLGRVLTPVCVLVVSLAVWATLTAG